MILTKNFCFLLEGEDWKRVRTIITPAFTSKRMRSMFNTFTMDVIAKAAFGTQIDSHNDPDNAFLKEAKKNFVKPRILTILVALILPTWILLRLSIFHLDRNHFFQNVIETVIKERKKTGKKYNDVLQILMDAADENEQSLNSEGFEDETDRFGSIAESNVSSLFKNKKLSKIELLSQCVLFFFAGFETTASVLTFLAYELAMNPEWQEKLIEEVDKAFEKHSEMSYDAVRDMKVLDAIVSEILRMYPVAILTERTASEDYELGNTGIKIEKGIRIAIPIYRMHYHPDLFQDPETFNPNRFMDPSETRHHPYSYLPFGAGPRNCLGMRFALLEIKVCMANILRHFRFRKDAKTQVKYKMGGFLSVNDLYLAVEKRLM
ncbi:Cytochrome P450 3A21 like protein [Argiope bruennichi]|uniref:Cytochrome P450 3A21 like protein n=1 Tax=Argiope bruennichi TaxID=94029 RepID=A0A8T0G008_ARGBR|nr:Cytochrome P450 3A21 like protein [Argiope bruennichi]